MDAGQKKEMVRSFINPSLCEITERLVYTDPYTNTSGKNKLFVPNEEFLERELYEDSDLLSEVAKLKFSFENKTQSLIHGDLHTGSIFVKSEQTMILDPEFAFVGPAGYDVGNVIANLIFAWVNASLTMSDKKKLSDFISWLENTIRKIVNDFAKKSLKILARESHDAMYRSDTFARWFIDDILTETAGVTGLELNRRIIGVAKVKDITGIADIQSRTLAERICVLTAKQCIMNREKFFKKGEDYINVLHSVWEKVQKNE
jgi:5-methylthioribose kinase